MSHYQENILQFFEYKHLPEDLQNVSAVLSKVAHDMVDELPRCAERTAGLRKLLEAKDCFVRAAVSEQHNS